jgi:NTE family protein
MALETRPHSAFECTALVLQGGGALGAYQAGVYEALATANVYPDWIAGISIGAINGALIAGNAPEVRVAKLRAFWERVTEPYWDWSGRLLPTKSDGVRQWLNQISAYFALASGARGFFTPRFASPCLSPAGHPSGYELLRYQPPPRDTRRLHRFRSHQWSAHAI